NDSIGAGGAWETVDWKSVGYWASLRASSPLVSDDGLNFLRINHPSAFSGLKYWEIGNEEYGNWEIDHHGTLANGQSTGSIHNSTTYSNFLVAFANFVKNDATNFPQILIGI